MLLSIYLLLLLLSALLLAIGYYANTPWMVLTGYTFFFLLGMTLTGIEVPLVPASGIEYKTGENTTTNYTYSNSTLTTTNEVQVHNYTTYSNRTIGLFFALSCILAFILTLLEYRVRRN